MLDEGVSKVFFSELAEILSFPGMIWRKKILLKIMRRILAFNIHI
jgi:hypothetical protein